MAMPSIGIKELREEVIPAAFQLSVEIFGPGAADEKHDIVQWRAHFMDDGILLGAYDGEALVGFKYGYRRQKGAIHSWLGGVRESYRGQGIARRLMEQQETLARERGFASITVNTFQEKFPAMYHLLQTSGYAPIATSEVTESGKVFIKTHFQKIL